MKQNAAWILTLVLVLAGLLALSHAMPPDRALDPLSVTALNGHDGDAVVLICGSQAAVVLYGDEPQRLADYLRVHLFPQVALLVHGENAQLQDLHAAVQIAEARTPESLDGQRLRIGDAQLHVACPTGGDAALTVTHGGITLTQAHIDAMRRESGSMQFISDGKTCRIRPDFSLWDNA